MDASSNTADNEDEAIEPVPSEVLEAFPENQQGIVRQAIMLYQEIGEETFSGPIPPPRIFREYEDVLPGAADRILKMAEKQQNHRHSLESVVVRANTRLEFWGLSLGFIISLVAMVGGFYLIFNGNEVPGIVAFLTSVAGLAGAFLYSRNRNEKERRERLKEVTPPEKQPQLPQTHNPRATNNDSSKPSGQHPKTRG